MKKTQRDSIIQEVNQDTEQTRLRNETNLTPALKMFQMFQHITNEAAIEEIIQPLRCIDFFKKACPNRTKIDKFIQQSVPFFTYEHIMRGKAVFHYGDPGDKFYIVLTGRVGVQNNPELLFSFIPRLDKDIQEDINRLVEQKHKDKGHRGSRGSIKKFMSTRDSLTAEEREYLLQWNGQKNFLQLEVESFLTLNDRKSTYFVQDHPVAKYQRVFEYAAGGSFGELALTTDQCRTASLIVLTDDAHLLSMTKNDFKKLNEKHMHQNNVKIDYFMHHFQGVSKQTIVKFTSFFHDLTFNTNTELWKEGEEVQFFFLIKTGKCELYKHVADMSPKKQFNHPSKLKIQRTKKLILSQLSDNSFIGDDDVIEHKQTRSYSCRITEISQVYYMTAEVILQYGNILQDFNTIRKSYPDIVKCLRDKHQMFRNYMSDRQHNMVQYQNEVITRMEVLAQPNQDNADRITVENMARDSRQNSNSRSNTLVLQVETEKIPVNVLRSYNAHVLTKNDIAETNEQLHLALLKRAENCLGHDPNEKFNMMSDDILNQIKQRIQLKFASQQGFEQKPRSKISSNSSSDILVHNLYKQKDKRDTMSTMHQQTINDLVLSFGNILPVYDGFDSTSSCKSIGYKPSLDRPGLLLSRATNPKHQDKTKLMNSIQTKSSLTKSNSGHKVNFSIQRIHSAAPKMLSSHNKNFSYQLLTMPPPIVSHKLIMSGKNTIQSAKASRSSLMPFLNAQGQYQSSNL